MQRVLCFLLLLAWPTPAQAAEDPLCEDDPPTLDKHGYLRALSLDLRGVVPTIEEHTKLEALDDVPEAWIDDWLDSEAFVERTLRLHRDLLWLRVLNRDMVNTRARLQLTNANAGSLYWRRDQAEQRRIERVPCLDEPAQFDADGSPVLTLVEEDGSMREGYVVVIPYWDPTDSVKVCALDAQEAVESLDGELCASDSGQRDAECGCGPSLLWCTPPGGEDTIRASLERDIELRIERVVREDRPYTDLFTSTTGFVNGPLAHWWRELAPHSTQISVDPAPILPAALPSLSWPDSETWVEVELGPQHAGVLTSLPYLLRFASDRGRANTFYERFLCRPFVAPAGGIPSSGDEVVTLDLQERDGCKYCHAILEPAAAHWGRWPENSVGYLSPDEFPPIREDCLTCATTSASCSEECREHYVVEALGAEEEPYLGQLRAYEFRDEAHEAGVEEGPALLVRQAVVDGRLGSCVARNAADWLLGGRGADAEWYDGIGNDFVGSDFSWRTLVRGVVTSDTYRRVR
jgi:hypothetical protein